MMRKLLWPTVMALLILDASARAMPQSVTLEQVFARLDEASKTFHAMEADVERTTFTITGGLNETETKNGKIYYAKAGKEPRLKLEFSKPQPEFVLIDKGKVQIYQPKIKQVQEASTAGHEDTVEMSLALGFGQTSQDLKKNFEVSLGADEVVDGQKRTVLDLKPRNSGTFRSMRLWLDQKSWHAVQVKAIENTDDYLIMKYTNIKTTASLPNSRFQLDLPKDVKVIKL